MINVIEQPGQLEVVSHTPMGMRVLFALLALIPLLAPYELVIRPSWQTYAHPFFLFAALISVGAVCLSVFLVFAAAAGLDSRTSFDSANRTATFETVAPFLKKTSSVLSLDELTCITVQKREWSDGAPSFYLRIDASDRSSFEVASSWSRGEIEKLDERIGAFLSDLE